MKQGSLNSKNWVITSLRKSKNLKELYYTLDWSWARRCVVSYQIINILNPTKQFCALLYMQHFLSWAYCFSWIAKNFLRGSVLNVNYAARLFNNEVNFAGTLLKRLAVTHNWNRHALSQLNAVVHFTRCSADGNILADFPRKRMNKLRFVALKWCFWKPGKLYLPCIV